MVGAVTTLIVIVAVFLAYNANNGLPFVPVYRVSVEVPNAARMVKNNEVRIGGTRVGVVESIEPVHVSPNQLSGGVGNTSGESSLTGSSSSAGKSGDTCCVAALLGLKIDKSDGPIPQDSIFRVRYRSSFGLKYLEIVRGTGPPAPQGFVFDGLDDRGDCKLPTNPQTFASTEPKTARNGCFQHQTEFDAINNTFNTKTRTAARTNLVGYGDAFAGRGESLNEAFSALKPLFSNLRPVAKVLANPHTGLRQFIEALARTSRIVAPVASQQADFFTKAGIAFAAISQDPQALRDTISEGPPTLQEGINTLPAQRTFLSKFAELSRRLNPGVRQLRLALPDLNSAVRIGTPVLAKTPPMNRRLRHVFDALKTLVQDPNTKISLTRLKTTFDQASPLAQYVAPMQTVCNYWNYWFTYLTEHITERDSVGYQQRIVLVNAPQGGLHIAEPGVGNVDLPGQVQTPVNGYSGLQANGKAGLLPNPAQNGLFEPHTLPILHGNPYAPTGQPQFNGPDGTPDCQSGQTGYVLGQYLLPGQDPSNPAFAIPNIPGAQGLTNVYFDQNGDRTTRDSRIASHQP
jgi:ABC-type transporter Mla subunit MlaD